MYLGALQLFAPYMTGTERLVLWVRCVVLMIRGVKRLGAMRPTPSVFRLRSLSTTRVMWVMEMLVLKPFESTRVPR